MLYFLRCCAVGLKVFLLVFFFYGNSTQVFAQFREKYKDEGSYHSLSGMSFVSPTTGFVAFDDGIGYTQDSGSSYIKRPMTLANTDFNGYSVNLTFGFAPSGVVAFTTDSLLVYGDYGAESSILFSANQGQNWKLVYHRPITDINQSIGFTMSDMQFPGNGNIGIAVNDKDILRSTNRGLSWTVVAQLSDQVISRFNRISFPSTNDGYAAAGDLLFKTINAGASWTLSNVPAGNSGLNFNLVSFIKTNIGYLVKDDDFTIFKTINGGNNWTKMNDANNFPVAGRDMHFTNDSTGFIAARYGYQVFKTSDNGVHWEACKRDTDFQNGFFGLSRMYFYNNNIAWAGGNGSFLMLTTNAGGKPKPKACFTIDTTNLTATAIVQLKNCSKPGYTFKWFRNDVLIATSYDTSYTHDFFNPADTIKLIVSNGDEADTLIQYQSFLLPPYRPVINSFYPGTGSNGTVVTITGSGFTDVNNVKFGNVNPVSFTVVNDNTITAVIANGASGNVFVADKYSANSLPGFTYFAPTNLPAPVVNTIVPWAAPVGTMVTITGNNFNTSIANNIISFGAVNAVVISASATQLTCKVPAGASMEPVTVFNKSSYLSGRSRMPYTVTFADSGSFTNNSFELATQVDYGHYLQPIKYPYYSIGKDIDGDGKPDLITAIRRYPDSIAVYRNTTTGKFISFDRNTNAGFITANGVSRFRVEDIDGDGKADIAFSSDNTGIKIARNLSEPGAISFAALQNVQNTVGGSDIALADIDGDGKNDIALARGGGVQLVRNTSSPGYLSFATPQNFAMAENPADIASVDIDGDGKTDIVAHNTTMLSCLRNTSTAGNISMAAVVNFTLPDGVPFEGKSMAVTDYDLDGKLDVIVFDQVFFCIYRNTSTPGNISFAAPVTHSLVDEFGDGWGGCVANLSGDIKPDILTGTQLLFRNVSLPGTVNTEAGVYINPHYSSSMNTADFDLDGKMDVIATSINFSMTSVYRNKLGLPIDFPICAGYGVEELQSNVGGATYQWQQDSGTGFKDIADGIYFTGTNSPVINFINIPSSYNGYKYRCKADNQYSFIYVLKPLNIWMGYADSNWENAANWYCGSVPDKNADVEIDGGNVDVNSNVEVRSIYLKPGANVTIKPGKTFKVTQ